MAENQDGQEKSQEATSKRVSDARKKGQVPRSRELNTLALTLSGVIMVMLLGSRLGTGIQELFRDNYVLTKDQIHDPHVLIDHLAAGIGDGLLMLLPFFAAMIVVAIAASIALGGFNVSFEAMQPKLSKLDPIKGLGRVFSVKGLMELVKSLAKFMLIGSATAGLIWLWLDDILLLAGKDIHTALSEGLSLLGWGALLLSSTLVVMAAMDVPFQLWEHKRQLKMTQQEVRDEFKETEGRPEVKGRIRQMQREMSQRRMMQQVPKADVIVTNPTHYAVALRYDPATMRAPIVLAKGSNLIALNIRKIGEEHAVPLVEAPMLARAIYFNTELDQPIPAGLFLAVAQLLAYVFQLRDFREQGGDIPPQPEDFPIPDEMQTAGPEDEQ